MLDAKSEDIGHHQHLPIRHHQVLQSSPLLVVLGAAFDQQLFGKEDGFDEVQGVVGEVERFAVYDLDVGVPHIHLSLRDSEDLALLGLLLLHSLTPARTLLLLPKKELLQPHRL
jgi:hypothetical protein